MHIGVAYLPGNNNPVHLESKDRISLINILFYNSKMTDGFLYEISLPLAQLYQKKQ